MVLPGIQAFFGFQLIAVFNNRFQDLTHIEQLLHLIALFMLALSIALIMTPAAYHRIAERGMISRHFVDLASRFLEFAMFPLMLSITVDLFLLARLVLDNAALSAGLALIAFLMFFGLWYVFPWTQGARERGRHRSGNNPEV